MPADSGIPVRLNVALVLTVVAVQFALLFLASHVHGWWLAAVAVAFAFLFLTAYALMHEASHGSLHPDPRWNRWLGMLTGLAFPASAAMMRGFHTVHHRCNRTDHEMFDAYFPGDRIWLKRAQWYAILTGLFWLIIPLGTLLVAWARPLLQSRPFRKARSAAVLFDNFDAAAIRQIRIESAILAAVWIPPLACGWLAPWPTLLLLATGGFNWSTRQYVTHAWSRRDVLYGAHNLAVSRPMRWLLLNGNHDQAHHRYPLASWIQLPALAERLDPPVAFWPQYLSQWRGPRLQADASPQPMPDLCCERPTSA